MKRTLVAVLASGAIFGGVFAFAATLDVNGNNLGAGSGPVAACDPTATEGVDASYTTSWDAVDDRFEVDSIVVSDIDGCAGEKVQVRVIGTSLDLGSTAAKTVPGGEGADVDKVVTFAIPTDLADDIPAAAVTTLHVVINDAPAA